MKEFAEIKNKKQFIIDRYIENKYTDFEQYELNRHYVWRTIEDYKRVISTTYEVLITKSLDLKNTYYIFADDEEKVLQVEDGIIMNPDKLTEYEVRWLEINKGWETYD